MCVSYIPSLLILLVTSMKKEKRKTLAAIPSWDKDSRLGSPSLLNNPASKKENMFSLHLRQI